MHVIKYLLIALCLFTSSCVRKQDDPAIVQARIRSMQTHTFVGHDGKKVIKEILAILQDEGYMIKNVSSDFGLLTAELDTNIEKFSSKFWAYLFSGKRARWKKHSVLEMTSNVTEEGNKTKVRINFLMRIYDNLGRVVDVHQIMNEEAYQDIFVRIQRGLLS
ncbi:MAG: hypothetical protein KR126chlam1_00232 [Chlamydiae bacterium]|nr:hypothetical protein [Chlamydiota bacterium]